MEENIPNTNGLESRVRVYFLFRVGILQLLGVKKKTGLNPEIVKIRIDTRGLI